MKSWMIIVLCICLAVSLTACSERGDTKEPATSQIDLDEASQAGANSSEQEHSALPDESDEPDSEVNVDYRDYVYPLGYFLFGPPFSNPSELTPADFVFWYAYRERSSHDIGYMQKYLEDGKDGFRFPQDEMESAVFQYFGVEANALRTDPVIYDAQNEIYITPAALPDPKYELGLIKVVDNGSKIMITVAVANEGGVYNLEVVADTSGDHIKYLSVVRLID